MRNPLNKRFSRELRGNLGKYAGMFFMMLFAVAFTSGFLLAAGSIESICLGMVNLSVFRHKLITKQRRCLEQIRIYLHI